MNIAAESAASHRPHYEAIKDIFQILICDDQGIPDLLPGPLQSNIQSVRDAHPEAAHHLLSGNDIRSFLTAHFDSEVVAAYDLFTPHSYKCNLARYCLLLVRGGLYVDLGIRFLARFEPPLGTALAAFRDCMPPSQAPWSVSNSIIFATPGRPELRTAIDLTVQNCKARYYGPSSLLVGGPGLFGRSIAICNNGEEYWMGDCRTVTPEFANRNVNFVTPTGILLALRTKLGNFDEYGINGTNNYTQLWLSHQVYGEAANHFSPASMFTAVGIKSADSVRIERGARGYALYGPYMPLPAGRHTIVLWFDPDTSLGSSTIDVCETAGGDCFVIKALDAGAFAMDKEGRVAFELDLASNLQKFEVRLQVNGDCEGRFLKFQIV